MHPKSQEKKQMKKLFVQNYLFMINSDVIFQANTEFSKWMTFIFLGDWFLSYRTIIFIKAINHLTCLVIPKTEKYGSELITREYREYGISLMKELVLD